MNYIEKLFKLKGFMYCIILALMFAILINKFILFKVIIPSSSMEPTLNVNDHLFIRKIYNYDNISRGDILVFHSYEGNDTYIKRVIGLPGDKIEIKSGVVYVNGNELTEDYVENNDDKFSGEYEVPKGKLFFLGDNRPISKDSRRWINSYIDKEDVIGKAIIKIYPFSDIKVIR